MVKPAIHIALLLAGNLAAGAALPAPPDLMLEAEVEPSQVHVQTQAIYRLRFYQGVDVRNLRITGPAAPLADFRPIGEGRVYEALRDGRRYRVHERSYAVFPFASGSLEIAGARAEGTVPAASSSNGRRSVHLEAAPRIVAILPVPAEVGIPARSLSLSETWSAPAQAGVGEIQRRHIRIEAIGVDAGQLPQLEFAIPGMAIHVEPARLENRFQGEVTIGSREQTFGLVPLTRGDIVVPALQLPWWNVDTGAPATATLPSRTLRIGAAGAPAAVAGPTDENNAPLGRWIAIAGLLGVVAAAAIWRRHVAVGATGRLRRACRSGKPDRVRDELLDWATRLWPERPPLTLGALAERLNGTAARRALGNLDRRLYGPATDRCDAKELAKDIRIIKRCMRTNASPPKVGIAYAKLLARKIDAS